MFKFRIYTGLFDLENVDPRQVASHQTCRLGKWYYDGEGQACFGKLPGYRELETPHIDVHKFGIAALEAKLQGDLENMLKHVEAMENASLRVIQSLQTMSDSALTSNAPGCSH